MNTSAATGTAIRNGTNGTMIADTRNGTSATGMKTMKAIPAVIETIAVDGNLLDLRPCRHDPRESGR